MACGIMPRALTISPPSSASTDDVNTHMANLADVNTTTNSSSTNSSDNGICATRLPMASFVQAIICDPPYGVRERRVSKVQGSSKRNLGADALTSEDLHAEVCTVLLTVLHSAAC
jgi:tRNA G10  N-methylase Trm11